MLNKSKCSKCSASDFEMVVENVKPEEQIHFVRCAKCLTVVGLVDRVVPVKNLMVIESKINDVKIKVDAIAKS